MASNTAIVVLQGADPVPHNAVYVNSVELGNNSGDRSYRELISSARKLALKSGANVVKIEERSKRSKNASEHLKVSLYKSTNPHAYEREFTWSNERKLSWEDFRGPVQPELGEDVAAATFCGIGFETNSVTASNPNLKVYVYNTFYSTKSWVRDGLRKPEILAHEQCHFDICELYTRKLRARMNDIDNIPLASLKATLKSVYKEVQDEYVVRQELYEEETGHGVVPKEQARWEKMIAAELKATERWKE